MTIDPNVTLSALRKRAEQARTAVANGSDYGPWLRTLLGYLADEIEELDAHLSAGGQPPEAWREGPDAPSDDPYCAQHGQRFDSSIGCPGCIGTPAERLEYLRRELRAERISYGELAELQDLAPHIEPGDVELLEAAGVPEFPTHEGCVIGTRGASHATNCPASWPHGSMWNA